MDVGSSGERLEQRPFRRGQVLEPVGERRLAVPGREVAAEPLAGASAEQVAIPEAEAVELVPVGGKERAELAVEVGRVEEPSLEVGERTEQRVREAGEPRRGLELPARSTLSGPSGDERALRPRGDGPAARVAVGDAREQVVERADRAAEQAARALEQVSLDARDVRPVRHDQDRLVVEAGQVALEQERDLARIRGPDDEVQSQASPFRPGAMVVRRPDGDVG